MIRKSRSVRPGGFSLIEVMVASAILGLGVTALLSAVGSGSSATSASREVTEAVFLAQEIREWTLKLPFSDPDPADADNQPGPDGSDPTSFLDDLDDMLNVTYSPPRDGLGYMIHDMTGWSQKISLTWRSATDLTTVVSNGSSDIIHVNVEILHQDRLIMTTGWLATRRQ